MKSILLVEDDELLREIIADALRLFNADCVVHAVDGGTRSIELLDEQTFDLLITDLCMPKGDGLTLLEHLRARRIQTPTIVITGSVAAGLEPMVRSLGARMYFHKPFDLQVLLVTAERFLLDAKVPAENRIQGFSLPSFLQLMEIDGKTSLVRVRASGNREGELCFMKGKLVSAQVATHSGDDAVVEILRWPEPEIRISDVASAPPASNVRALLAGLLLRSAHDRDEAAGGG